MDILSQRLFNQSISQRLFTQPIEIVNWMGAVQAQDFAAAKWALGLRATGLTEAVIEQAFNAGEIIRTHVLRPTWHFVTPADLRWMLMLTSERVKQFNATYDRKFGLEDAIFHQSQTVLERTLQGGKALPRPALESALQEAGIITDDLRATLLVMRAELDGVLCSGPRQGKQFTYMLLEERVAPAPQRTRAEALAELTLRYFTSHGPATPADFSWWSGLTLSDARKGVETVNSQLTSETLEGQTYWFNGTTATGSTNPQRAFLLPNYDEYTVAYTNRSAINSKVRADKLDTRGNVLFNNVLIIDGHVAGTWKRTLKTGKVIVELIPFFAFAPDEQPAVEAVVAQYGTFLGLPAVLSIKE